MKQTLLFFEIVVVADHSVFKCFNAFLWEITPLYCLLLFHDISPCFSGSKTTECEIR